MSPNPQGDIEYTCTQGFIMLEKSPERNPVQHLKPKKKAFNCETCDFKSQKKYNLEVHMKNKHESTRGDNLLKNRPRASTSEYKQLPINLRLFQNTVKLLDNLFLSEKAKIRN